MKQTFLFLSILFINLIFSQNIVIKDGEAIPNTLIQINDEGMTGSIELPSGETPVPTTNKLYNEGGTLKWSGEALSISMGVRASLSYDTAYQAATDGFVTARGSTPSPGSIFLFLSSNSTFGTIASFSDWGTTGDKPSFVYPISKGTWWKVTKSASVSTVDVRWISFGN